MNEQLRSPVDDRRITNLCYRYAELLDQGRFEAVASLLQHATLFLYRQGEPVAEPLTGIEAIKGFYEDNVITHNGLPHTKHLISNLQIEYPEDGSVSARSYFQVIQSLEGFGLQPIAAGRYVDSFAKHAEQWEFVAKEIHADHIGDETHHKVGFA